MHSRGSLTMLNGLESHFHSQPCAHSGIFVLLGGAAKRAEAPSLQSNCRGPSQTAWPGVNSGLATRLRLTPSPRPRDLCWGGGKDVEGLG
jgi:hypothetical protein